MTSPEQTTRGKVWNAVTGGFLGITDVTFVAADGLAMDREAGMARAQKALEQIAA